MQKLYFEPAWDKTIAPANREKIIHYFQQQTKQPQDDVHLSFLWEARNYKGERLITVLIHNFKEISFRIHNTVISYYEQDKQLAMLRLAYLVKLTVTLLCHGRLYFQKRMKRILILSI